ncbi:F-box protein PP2-B1-like [Triticum urartu]|nr:F-box protein PP2-B1-like [Triticum urartu]
MESTMKQARKEYEEQVSGGVQRIPEECLEKAIGLTSPADACRASAVSAAFRSAADSDAVWERFLPPDCDAMLERAVHVVDSSKKDLFMELSDEHVLLDDGKRSFGLHRSTGAKCYMLSASELAIAWGKIDLYWRERLDPDSRFPMVAELISVCWFSIFGVINSRELSPSTHYAAYLVFKLTHDASGLSSRSQISYVEVGGQVVGSARTASFHPCNRASCSGAAIEEASSSTMSNNCAVNQPHEHKEEDEGGIVRYPRERVDGWLELEMGDFHTGTGDDAGVDFRMELHEFEELQWKKGLILEGIEIRPKN